MRMVQPPLAACLRRAFHSSSRAHAAAPLSVAHLLETLPADADNVTVNGFIRSIRNQKQRSFASIGDGSSLEPLQALLPSQLAEKSGLHPPGLYLRVNI
jgi:asparaginyl-tRNA synthetase